MDGKRREEIKARAEAATPGEWEAFQLWEDGDIITGGGNFEICTPEYDVCAYIKNSAPIRREADAAFIAHARQDIPDLLDEVERLSAQVVAANRTLEAALREMEENRDFWRRLEQQMEEENARLREIVEEAANKDNWDERPWKNGVVFGEFYTGSPWDYFRDKLKGGAT